MVLIHIVIGTFLPSIPAQALLYTFFVLIVPVSKIVEAFKKCDLDSRLCATEPSKD
jgi:hypothetical protein